MTSIIEFLEARNAEDEAIAIAASSESWQATTVAAPHWRYDRGQVYNGAYGIMSDDRQLEDFYGRHIARHDPARILREVAAKRAIIGWWAEMVGWNDKGRIQDERTGEWCRLPILPPVLERLASAYADHPDFNPEWAL